MEGSDNDMFVRVFLSGLVSSVMERYSIYLNVLWVPFSRGFYSEKKENVHRVPILASPMRFINNFLLTYVDP